MNLSTENREKYIQDLADIKDMMHRSSKFTALSGLSGILAGVAGLVGGYFTYALLEVNQIKLQLNPTPIDEDISIQLLIIAASTLLTAKVFIFFFTSRRMRSNQESIMQKQTQRLMIHLFIPMLAGGLIIVKLLFNDLLGLSIAATLVFYGLGLINASKFTLDEMRSLGILQVLLGVLAVYFPAWSLIIWMVGFGLLHIAFGIYMHFNLRS